MNIAVLCGGISTEREVSINTGNMICKALRSKGHNAIVLDVYFGCESADVFSSSKVTYDIEKEIENIKLMSDNIDDAKASGKVFFGKNVIEICRQADITFIGLHGENGENGKVQAAFDLLGIKYTGSGYLGSALAMDKNLTKIMLKSAGIPMAEGIVLKKGNERTELKNYAVKIPCVVKPCCGGSSVGVTIVEKNEQFEDALINAFKYEDEIIIEEFIKGREFSVGILGGRALPVIEIIPKEGFYDYKNKYTAGATEEICPALISEQDTLKMQQLAEKSAKALGLFTYCRIDFLMKENGDMYCLEANTLPGMTATSLIPQEAQAEGIDFETLCDKIIELSLHRYSKHN